MSRQVGYMSAESTFWGRKLEPPILVLVRALGTSSHCFEVIHNESYRNSAASELLASIGSGEKDSQLLGGLEPVSCDY